MNAPLRVGLLVGRERSFPDALIRAVNASGEGVVAEYASVDLTRADDDCPYSVLVDRISHEVPCYQAFLKHAALTGTRVVNNPFWRISDDKFFNTALAARLGVAVPRTRLLPSKSYGPDISSESLRNLAYPLSWGAMFEELGFPMFVKPHWGGGWRDVHRVTSPEDFFRVYDQSGEKAMIAQEGIRWTQYVRCVVIGQTEVLPAPWDPRLGHFERYTGAERSMPPLEDALRERVVRDARTLCTALGYDMNTVEFAIRDGVPYAIDFMNSAPDFDVSSLGERQFDWVVRAMAKLVIARAKEPRPAPRDVASLFHRA
jgi:glutathione synthase/RimK-type ligase-like ATP-grasp enzyme